MNPVIPVDLYQYTPTIRRTVIKFGTVAHMQEMCVCKGSLPPPPQGAEPQHAPILWGSLYLCLHPLMQNDQIGHGNTYEEGMFQGVNYAIAFCTNALHGLSAKAEFFDSIRLCICVCTESQYTSTTLLCRRPHGRGH